MQTATFARKLMLSELAPNAMQSEIRAMSVACSDARGINMAQGVCDTDPPAPVARGAIAAITDGDNSYTRLEGITALRQAIATKLLAYNGLDVDPETQLLVTSGTTGALHAACMALLNPGDEVIVLEPFYGYHVSTLRSLRLVPVIVPLDGTDFGLDGARIRAALTPRTRAIVVNSPGNPTGRVFSRAELETIAAIAQDADLFCFTDEIYEYFVYDGRQHVSLATLPGMRERTITISGFSKTFSVTGWRVGYLAADRRWVPAIGYFHDLTYVCAPSPLQHGALAGLMQLPESFYAAMAVEYQAKRDMVCDALEDAGMKPHVPEGAYYVLADASRLRGANAKERARNLLAEIGVGAVAGSAFFRPGGGEELLRFCFAKKDEELAEACRRLRTL